MVLELQSMGQFPLRRPFNYLEQFWAGSRSEIRWRKINCNIKDAMFGDPGQWNRGNIGMNADKAKALFYYAVYSDNWLHWSSVQISEQQTEANTSIWRKCVCCCRGCCMFVSWMRDTGSPLLFLPSTAASSSSLQQQWTSSSQCTLQGERNAPVCFWNSQTLSLLWPCEFIYRNKDAE